MTTQSNKFGTAPVFLTAISTILGAILFLRFGYAVGTLGFWGVILIIFVGHLVTIPTALAISEIATNKRVEGGGEYFIISRSFGLNIGATIGIALFFSQAISVAFYVIAFTEAFEFLFNLLADKYDILLPRQVISLPVMAGLALLIIKKGANLGVKALYFVVAILFISIIMFFLGSTEFSQSAHLTFSKDQFRNFENFFVVFAIIFPAFTGMTAGVGLSGDLKNPSKSIPMGTVLATVSGMILYVFIVYKLTMSASIEDLTEHQLIMGKIAIAGAVIVPLGLAASTISSALGSVMVAPRTLQALALDHAFPSKRINRWLSKANPADNEPQNASIVTVAIAFVFVALGDVNAVASIISMFFMVTYGSLCLISFLNHFGASPSYRPTFRSRWYLSLVGFLVSIWVMFKISTSYALLSAGAMTLIYLYINHYHKNRKDFASLFANSLFQLNRKLQVHLQKRKKMVKQNEWRPSAICISDKTTHNNRAFQLLSWISYRYGFGTFLYLIEGYYSSKTVEKADDMLNLMLDEADEESYVYIDTIISPSYTSAIAQAIQIPGVAGMENNMVIFEYNKEKPVNLGRIIENFALVNSGDFDICVLASSQKKMKIQNGIHVWINSFDTENANLMILLSFIILGHPDLKKASIEIFVVCHENEVKQSKDEMKKLVLSGRMPITEKNIKIIQRTDEISTRAIINKTSKDAGLILVGLREEMVKHEKENTFAGYDDLGTILFVHSKEQKAIE
ncbi:Amino acid transporter [Draconibacterium orientale]|uniref:Amino acid permease n=1 Tax=Draconibacterium orientale TaxID=1168034 RepID=X5E1M6_9BACT|nr:amino acid permease [Draconibacterium orientale]AHW60491.1 amino acid permease [Draconibacterium orientale]SET43391.1 Amino acid transporter [Draconibacterium orientale]